MHYFMREPRNYRKMWILHFCPKDLCLQLSEFWSLKKKSVFSILPTPYTTCNNRGQNTLGDKWQQHVMVTDHSMCTGQATSCSNMSRRHVAATNRFVCTGELFWKSLTPKQNFVAAISRKKSNRLNLCHLLQRKMHFTGLKPLKIDFFHPTSFSDNHGHKSWDTFAFLGRFPIHTGPTPPLTTQTKLDACIQNFFWVSTLYRVWGGRTAKQILKMMHRFMREPRNYRTRPT